MAVKTAKKTKKKRRFSAVLIAIWFNVETIPFMAELFSKNMNKIQPIFDFDYALMKPFERAGIMVESIIASICSSVIFSKIALSPKKFEMPIRK